MRVLVVDDEVGLSEAIKAGLASEGFVVDLAHDGINGQVMAQHNEYDALVLDIMLPGRNGYDVLRNLRDQRIWTPTIMLSAKDGEYDQTDAFDLGADDYLTKPFSFPVLVARLRALVRRGAPARPVVLEAGDLVLDPTRKSVERAGVPIMMTAKEYTLLHYFMRHTGAVLSKADILDNVWDSAYEGGDNIVEVYIGYLRKKVDQPFGVQSLATVRGQGYRLSAVTSSGPVSS